MALIAKFAHGQRLRIKFFLGDGYWCAYLEHDREGHGPTLLVALQALAAQIQAKPTA